MYYDPMQYRIHFSFLAEPASHRQTVAMVLDFLEQIGGQLVSRFPVISEEKAPVNISCTQEYFNPLNSKADAMQQLFQIISRRIEHEPFYAHIASPRKIPDHYNVSSRNRIQVIKTVKGFYERAEKDPNIAEMVSAFLNCPTPDLKGIVKPFGWSRPDEFDIEFRWGKTGEPASLGDITHPGWKAYYVSIHLPRRYGITGDFIEQFAGNLDQMSALFQMFMASITLDIANDESYILVYRNKRGLDSFHDRISGVCWGMWLTESHKKVLLQSGFRKETAPFHIIRELPNGGIFLQISESVDWLTSEQNKLAYLSLTPLLKETDIAHPIIDVYSLRDYVRPSSIIYRNGAILIA